MGGTAGTSGAAGRTKPIPGLTPAAGARARGAVGRSEATTGGGSGGGELSAGWVGGGVGGGALGGVGGVGEGVGVGWGGGAAERLARFVADEFGRAGEREFAEIVRGRQGGRRDGGGRAGRND